LYSLVKQKVTKYLCFVIALKNDHRSDISEGCPRYEGIKYYMTRYEEYNRATCGGAGVRRFAGLVQLTKEAKG